MTNADKFKEVFGLYATELWAKSEKEFLEWLNDDVPETNVGDMISRQAAIDILCRALHYNYEEGYAVTQMYSLPSAQPEHEYTMEEFMYGQDMGNPEDGSL